MKTTAPHAKKTLRGAAVAGLVLALLAVAVATPAPASAVPRLAFVTDGQVRVVGADGSDERPIAWSDEGTTPVTRHRLSGPSWSPDGTRVAFGDTFTAGWSAANAQLRIASADGLSDDVVLEMPAAGIIETVQWSPAGDKLAFVVWTTNPPVQVATWTTLGDRWEIYLVNADGSGLRPVAPVHARAAANFDFSPDGSQLAFVSDQEGVPGVFTVAVDGVALPKRVSPLEVSAGLVRWSPDGARIAFTGTAVTQPDELLMSPRIWTVAADGTDARPLPVRTYDAPAWSPDSRTLAFACTDGCGLASIGIDGTAHRVLTPTLGRDLSPAWSRHGLIAFMREEGTTCCTRNLWVMEADGGNQRRVSAAGSVAYSIAWSQ